MLVLGIDPGSHCTGYGLVRASGNRLTYVASGTFDLEGELIDRLCALGSGLEAMLARERPDVAAVESIFFENNAKSALLLGHARGVVLWSLAKSGTAICEYAPAETKRAVTGNGRATKDAVRRMVRLILGIQCDLAADAADALAAAICHAQLRPKAMIPRDAKGVASP
jgi:crossover junction endodeoxyribonuclease RuvC